METRFALALLSLVALPAALATPPEPAGSETLAARIEAPSGFSRAELEAGGFGEWLRELPLLPGRPAVKLFDGRVKPNQAAHHAVVDLDVGGRDLQQCADAVIRLRAEYLRAAECDREIAFDFTSGDRAAWSRWSDGWRPRVSGNEVTWRRSASPDASYGAFRRYLDTVFTYAGTWSLQRELEPVPDPDFVAPGDVFIQGGFPGHAVLVVDVATRPTGGRAFLLAQSFMPAQQVHLLRNPARAGSPWFYVGEGDRLVTPEWIFDWSDLRRFPVSGCS